MFLVFHAIPEISQESDPENLSNICEALSEVHNTAHIGFDAVHKRIKFIDLENISNY